MRKSSSSSSIYGHDFKQKYQSNGRVSLVGIPKEVNTSHSNVVFGLLRKMEQDGRKIKKKSDLSRDKQNKLQERRSDSLRNLREEFIGQKGADRKSGRGFTSALRLSSHDLSEQEQFYGNNIKNRSVSVSSMQISSFDSDTKNFQWGGEGLEMGRGKKTSQRKATDLKNQFLQVKMSEINNSSEDFDKFLDETPFGTECQKSHITDQRSISFDSMCHDKTSIPKFKKPEMTKHRSSSHGSKCYDKTPIGAKFKKPEMTKHRSCSFGSKYHDKPSTVPKFKKPDTAKQRSSSIGDLFQNLEKEGRKLERKQLSKDSRRKADSSRRKGESGRRKAENKSSIVERKTLNASLKAQHLLQLKLLEEEINS